MKKNNTLIFGVHPLLEAIKSDKEIEKVLIQNGLRGDSLVELKLLLADKKIPYQYVPIEKLNRTCNGNHQGVIAYICEIDYQPLDNILMALFDAGKDPLLLILDRITDVRNFGAIARTAECAGVDAIIVPKKGTALITSDSIKTSAGALNRVAVCREDDLVETLKYLKNSGISIAAASEKSNKTIYQWNYNTPMAIIMGSEEDGISKEIIELADEKLKIPLQGEIGSLNVSVATGIILYEAIRQKLAKKN